MEELRYAKRAYYFLREFCKLSHKLITMRRAIGTRSPDDIKLKSLFYKDLAHVIILYDMTWLGLYSAGAHKIINTPCIWLMKGLQKAMDLLCPTEDLKDLAQQWTLLASQLVECFRGEEVQQ